MCYWWIIPIFQSSVEKFITAPPSGAQHCLCCLYLSYYVFVFIYFFLQKVNYFFSEKNAVSLKETLSLPHEIPTGRPPSSGDIHFPLIVFNSSLPLETASSHSSFLAAVTLKETPNQNICLSFSLRSDRWMRADTTGRCIRPNRGLIFVSPPSECFISTGHLWIRYLALIWRNGSWLPECQVKSQRQWLRHGRDRWHGHSAFARNVPKFCSCHLSIFLSSDG